LNRAAALAVHTIALFAGLLTLVLVGQPVYANDTWIHLALGEAFAAAGPWLDADPHLFAAPGPPAPSSWLGSLLLFAAQDTLGFAGLRLLHVAVVLLLLLGVHRVARVTTGSTTAASLSLVGFIVLATFRLVQLRPELLTLCATFVLFALLLTDRAGPDARRIAAAAALTAVWANVHAGFVLAPVLTLGTAASLAALRVLPGRPADEGARALRLGIAGVAQVFAGLANPLGVRAYSAYFSAGEATLALGAVVDEWSPLRLFALPVPLLPPTWATWLLAWGCLVATVAGGVALLRERVGHRHACSAAVRIDPALLAWSSAGLLASLVAARFLWLCVFGVMLGCVIASRVRVGKTTSRAVLASLTLALLVAHLGFGDWPLVSRALKRGPAAYLEPYRPAKYFGHAMWFLEDTGLEGRIYNDYPLGGFMSFWHTPRLRMSASGTMNVERSAMERFLAIGAHAVGRPGTTLGALVEESGIDLFLGTGLPVFPTAARPIQTTVRHLEGDPAWIPAFRSLRSALYIRRPGSGTDAADQRRRANLNRVAAYYARAGVPFDPDTGFAPEQVLRAAPEWARTHGLVPSDFEHVLVAGDRERAAGQFGPAADRAAELFAVLGAYEAAIDFDRASTEAGEGRRDRRALQRSLWCALQRDDLAHARRLATALDRARSTGGRPGWGATVEALSGMPRSARLAEAHLMPLFPVERGRAIQVGVAPPVARWARSDDG